ncbi:MAG: hypothetical protein Q8L62_05895 [Candidatus Nitrotoga sp.]|nr:hypothetical protein [Candidatus Nitrotoga sp.]
MLNLPKKPGRPSTGAKSAAERQRDSRARRKALTFDSYSGQQISLMLSPEAVQALSMLSYNCDMSRKEVIERLLCNAYEMAKTNI